MIKVHSEWTESLQEYASKQV